MKRLHTHEHGRSVDTVRDEPTPVRPARLEPNFRPDFGIESYRSTRWYQRPWAIFRAYLLFVALCAAAGFVWAKFF